MADTAGIIAAISGSSGVLVAVGTTGRFVWNKIERRFAAIDAELDECRKREKASQDRRIVHTTVIELMWQEIKRLSGNRKNATLSRAEKLLAALKQESEK